MTVNRTKRHVDPTKEILKGITSYLEGADAAPDEAQAESRKRLPMKISSRVLSDARRRIDRKARQADAQKVSIFVPAEPAPGVLPTGHKIAMDEMPFGGDVGLGSLNAWAWNGGTQFAEGTTFLGYPYLAELTQRPEYRKGVERVATEMTRKWIEFEVTSDADGKIDDAEKKARSEQKGQKIKAIENRMIELKVRGAFRVAAEHDGYFGRGHLFLDIGARGAEIDPAELTTPIGSGHNTTSKEKVNKRNPLRAVRNVEPMWAYPQQYNSTDPLAPDWYRPKTWFVMARPVHASRFLTLVGREVPDILKPAYAFGGLAMTQMAKPYVDNWLRTRQAVCDLIESFSVSGVYTNMASALQAGFGGDEGADSGSVIDRMELFNLIRTNSGSMVLDKDTEEFFNISTPLGTLDALQAQAQEQMASVWSIPVAILLGLQPKGLNASSEAEVRIFYDFIGSSQENLFRDPLTVVVNLIQLSLFDEIDKEITFKFLPLWSLSDKERAEVKKIEAETGQILIDGGTIHPEEERRRVANDKDMGYTSIDVEDVPEPPAEPDVGGGEDPGDGGDGKGAPPDGEKKPVNPPAGKDAPAQDGAVPFLVTGDSAEWSEGDHPRGQPRNAGQFGSGGGGASQKPAKGKRDRTGRTRHGGLWKGTGKGPAADHAATTEYVLSQAPKSGINYRNMVAELIRDADKHGAGDKVGALKIHLGAAYENAAGQLRIKALIAATPAEASKLTAMADKANARAKELGWAPVAPPAPDRHWSSEGGVTPEKRKFRVQTRAKLVQEGLQNGLENLSGFDNRTGAPMVLEGINKTSGTVGFTPELIKTITDPASQIELHHNHPSGSSFSSTDLEVIAHYPGLVRIYAHGHEGSTYQVDGAVKGVTRAKKLASESIYSAIGSGPEFGSYDPKIKARVLREIEMLGLQKVGWVTGYESFLAPDVKKVMDEHREKVVALTDHAAVASGKPGGLLPTERTK